MSVVVLTSGSQFYTSHWRMSQLVDDDNVFDHKLEAGLLLIQTCASSPLPCFQGLPRKSLESVLRAPS